MRWFAWVVAAFFALVTVAGLVIASVSISYVEKLRSGTWGDNSLLVDAVVAAARGGEDPLELFQFYIGFGFVVAAMGIIGAAITTYLGMKRQRVSQGRDSKS